MRTTKSRVWLTVLLCCGTAPLRAQPPATPEVNQQPKSFTRHVNTTFSGKYLLYLPKDYGKEAQRRWPLIMYLHGASGRGDNLALVEREGLPFWLKAGQELPFIVVSPQCPADEWWDSHWSIANLNALLDEVAESQAVDISRIYLTGWSMGGSGTWKFAASYPERFAAIAPLCGKSQIRNAPPLKHVAVWAFHGTLDKTVAVEESRKMVDAVKAAGGDVKLTELEGDGHGIWESVYKDTRLYDWFLEHRRK